VQQETKLCGLEYRRSRVYSFECGSLRSIVASQAPDNLFDREMDPTIIHCDNQRCVKLSEDPVFHDRNTLR
jgi:hypothetical protein